ncbi:hypothetical protein [Simiduia aestuariiviva]|uniref:Uncharacterized protein n=1 Tax=Simiduia aestuariiviva TaxID=1510459 RepID=A0A839UMH6_9GAMM|nr:hypothetical protein [Simiduia aestuariiviva]MBB3167760.1 hypothetical protein [Simiduia aestuariiviva]
MITPYQRQLTILFISALLLIVLVGLITYFATDQRRSDERTRSDTKHALGIVTSRPKFGAFAGTGVCEAAIRGDVQGKIVTLHVDPRSANYNEYEKTNSLLFLVDVVPEGQAFLSEQLSTKQLNAQCITSAESNQLVKLLVAPASKR